MKKLKIVIISYSCTPRNAISVHRPSWARYWSENGHEVTVLTAKKQSYDQPLDLDFPILDKVKVIELSYGIFWVPLLKFPIVEKIGKWLKN